MKQTLLFAGPVATRSGYGAHSRDLLRSLISMDLFDISVSPTIWGNTPMDALDPVTDNDIISLFIKSQPPQPDVFVQVTIPNEFQKFGKFLNIGITAGIETDLISPSWVEGCNRMDMIIVPSQFAKDTFIRSKWKVAGDRELVITKPIHVLFEGVDTEIYKAVNVSKTMRDLLNFIPESFVFLFTGHWLNGDIGADRKNVSTMLLTFFQTFSNVKNPPALLLKTGNRFSKIEEQYIKARIDAVKNYAINNFKIKKLPNVYVLFGELTDSQMNELYNHSKINAMISFTHGEGYGRPLAEFATTGKPIIASNWSGYLDFLNDSNSILVNGELGQPHESVLWKDIIIPESKWFNINGTQAAISLSNIFNKYQSPEYVNMGRECRDNINTNFSLELMKTQFKELMSKLIDDLDAPQEFPFNITEVQNDNKG
jgi:glycosyltransferase involved in cell wall biosynthesis